MVTLKAGCFLINKKTKKIALIYRKKQDDYSFPKGHNEKGETIKETAIRETSEETKRIPEILDYYEPFIENYTTKNNEKCKCYMFFALDKGKSNNDSIDTHDVIWTSFEKVNDTLSYDSLKETWNHVQNIVKEILDNN